MTFPAALKSALYGIVQLPSAANGKTVFSTISFLRFLCSSLEVVFMSYLPPFAYLISLLHHLQKA